MTDQCYAAPPRLTIGRYRWEFERGFRFGLCDTYTGHGVGRNRTPWGAWFALQRWKKQPARPMEMS